MYKKISLMLIAWMCSQFLFASNAIVKEYSNAAILSHCNTNKKWSDIVKIAKSLLDAGYYPVIIQNKNDQFEIGHTHRVPVIVGSMKSSEHSSASKLKSNHNHVWSFDQTKKPYIAYISITDKMALLTLEKELSKLEIKNMNIVISIQNHISLKTIFKHIKLIKKYLPLANLYFTERNP